MGVKVDGTSITMTRADTFIRRLKLKSKHTGEDVHLSEGDRIEFAVTDNFNNLPIFQKEIDKTNMLMIINPDDTKELPYGRYRYDVQVTLANGFVDTVIEKGRLKLAEEVTR